MYFQVYSIFTFFIIAFGRSICSFLPYILVSFRVMEVCVLQPETEKVKLIITSKGRERMCKQEKGKK